MNFKSLASAMRGTLDTVVSPMVYIMTSVSFLIGFSYVFLGFLPDIQHTFLYTEGVLIGLPMWGVFLMVGSASTLFGLRKGSRDWTARGSMLCFMMWIFAGIMYLSGGYFFLLVTYAMFHMSFYGYVYLATNLGMIERVKTDYNN